MELTDTRYEVENGLAWITIDRPDRMNAFRARTVDELIHLFTRAWAASEVGVICLTGAGDRAFCAGGDQKQRARDRRLRPERVGAVRDRAPAPADPRRPQAGDRRGQRRRDRGRARAPRALRRDDRGRHARRFGQVGPRVGSFDGGFGTAYLARVVGEKRAREIWFRCRRYDAATAERWGLVNQVVPLERLRDEVRAWADDMLALSPTALRFLKQSFNADTEHIAGHRPARRSAGSGCSPRPTRRGRACGRSPRIARRTSRAYRARASRLAAGHACGSRTAPSRSDPGSAASRSSRRSEFSRVVPSSRWRITPGLAQHPEVMRAGRLRDREIEALARPWRPGGQAGDDPQSHRIAQSVQHGGQLDLLDARVRRAARRAGSGRHDWRTRLL